MKHFAKSLVSVVIALSILATMCIVGVSAVAEEADTNTVGYTLVSANVTKKTDSVATMNPSVDPNKATISVVNTADLTGGVSGVPSAQAYKVETVKKENGIVFPVSLTEAAATDIKTNGAYLDAWIHVGEATASNIVVRMYKTGARNNGGTTPTYGAGREGHSYNGNSWDSGIKTWAVGWYHFVWKINAGTDLAGLAELSVHDHKNGVNDSVNTVTFSVAAVRIVPTQADAEKAWAPSAPAPEEPKDSYTVFVDPDAETNVNSGTWDTEDKQEGKASYKMNSNAATAPSISISAEQGWKGYLWVYIDDVTKVGELFWEISSDNDCKGACVRYIKRQASGTMADLKNGWNKIEFELHDSTGLADTYNKFDHAVAKSFSDKYYYYLGNNMTGNVDWANINYVRVIAQPANGGGATVKVNAFTLYKPVVEPEKDANKVGTTIISANLAKSETNLVSINGGSGSVVKTSDLKGGTAGVPSADAYKVNLSADKSGLAFAVENTDWETAAKANLKNYGVNMWIWISDASQVNNLVLRFYGENGNPTSISDWCFQWNSQGGKKSSNFQTGWNNITLWFPESGDFDRRVNGVGINKSVENDGTKIVTMSIHDHHNVDGATKTTSYDVAIACARLVTTADDVTGGWLAGSATGDAVNVAMVVVAILLAAMAASVTVYFGKKAR